MITVLPGSMFSLIKVSKENEEQSSMTCRRIRPIFLSASLRSTAAATMVLPSPPPAALAGFLATDDEFIHLDTAGQLLPVLANRASPELLQPAPGGVVAAEAQKLFEIDGIDTGLSGREPPHGLKPVCDRLFRTVHYRTGR